ncbi:MAG: VTC domain-containing protein, partial [Spirochaetales bacterium]|nr:VTC domain-containing protein [Spirochaetales bacterium]
MAKMTECIDKTKQISVYRNELKYYISYVDYFKIRQILGNFLKTDRNAATADGYWIRSLYFDTPDNVEYIDKIVGVENRKKIRL